MKILQFPQVKANCSDLKQDSAVTVQSTLPCSLDPKTVSEKVVRFTAPTFKIHPERLRESDIEFFRVFDMTDYVHIVNDWPDMKENSILRLFVEGHGIFEIGVLDYVRVMEISPGSILKSDLQQFVESSLDSAGKTIGMESEENLFLDSELDEQTIDRFRPELLCMAWKNYTSDTKGQKGDAEAVDSYHSFYGCEFTDDEESYVQVSPDDFIDPLDQSVLNQLCLARYLWEYSFTEFPEMKVELILSDGAITHTTQFSLALLEKIIFEAIGRELSHFKIANISDPQKRMDRYFEEVVVPTVHPEVFEKMLNEE